MTSSELPLLTCTPSSIGDVFDWLNHIPKTLQDYVSCETILPMCIFKLPDTLTSEKPDAYHPQNMGLGPIHRFRASLYLRNEQHKLVTAREILKPYNITSEFETIVKDRIIDLVTILRCCYDLSFDVDNTPLAWVFAIDAVILLDILLKVTEGSPTDYLDDVIMLENQIPLVVLIQLLDALNINLSGESNTEYLTDLVIKFCETRSPIKFTVPNSVSDLDIGNRLHLLDCMYHLKICHARLAETAILRTDYSIDIDEEEETDGGIFSILDAFLEPFKSALNLPWDSLAKLINLLFGETVTKLEIDIPSVSALVNKAKIEFILTEGGIRDIEFNEEKLTFCLPLLELKSDSEVILRNLVAYEEYMYRNGNLQSLEGTEYLDFMCGIIDNEKDVTILRDKNIISGDLEDKEIAKLFNGITKSSGHDELEKSALLLTIEKVNTYYGNVPSVKMYYFMKNLFIASWKIALILFAILGLLCMIFIGIREVYSFTDLLGVDNAQLEFLSATMNNELLVLDS